MSAETAAPGWYHAQGDPAGTQRYWDGTTWSESPVPVMPTAGFPAAPPELASADGATRKPWEWWWHVVGHNYANFSGRATRAEYWWFTFVNVVGVIAFMIPLIAFGRVADDSFSDLGVLMIVAMVLIGLGLAIPGIAVTVRRLHDIDRSGWWYLIAVIPIVSYVGSFVILIFTIMDGSPCWNRYGPDPKGRNN